MDLSPLSSPIESPPSSRVAPSRAGVEGSSKAAMIPDDASDLSDLSDSLSPPGKTAVRQGDKGTNLELPRVGYSPVGSSISRPLSKVGVKVYGKNRTTLSSPKSPIASTSRISPPNSSPLTVLSSVSPSKRKRQPGPSTPSTPSKRSKGALAAKSVGQGAKPLVDYVDLTSPSSTPTRGRAARANRERVETSPSPSVKRSKATSSKNVVSIRNLHESFLSMGGQGSSKSHMNSTVDENWSLESLKDFVWVKVNENNTPFDNDVDDYFWWPAKVRFIVCMRFSIIRWREFLSA